MIVSHKHQYVFVEIPQTGCSAISKELRINYDGEDVLYKHATYNEFLQQASRKEKGYFVFAGLRNPLEVHVSGYFKYKNNHKGNYTNPDRFISSGVEGSFVTQTDLTKFDLIHNKEWPFDRYFAQFHSSIYNNYYMLLNRRFDYIVRFENLSEDFEKAIALIGLKQVRPLPHVNKTDKGDMDEKEFWIYYTDLVRATAVATHGPFLKKWGYNFPDSWGHNKIPMSSYVRFYSMDIAINFIAQFSTINPHYQSPMIERIRAIVRKFWG